MAFSQCNAPHRGHLICKTLKLPIASLRPQLPQRTSFTHKFLSRAKIRAALARAGGLGRCAGLHCKLVSRLSVAAPGRVAVFCLEHPALLVLCQLVGIKRNHLFADQVIQFL